MNRQILVVAAHPDDEILGVGGTIIKHAQDGDMTHVLILGEGAMSRANAEKKEIEILHKSAARAGEIIGFKNIFFAHFPDNSFDTVSLLKITKEVEKYVEEIKPDIIYTHHKYDLNVDHRLVFEAVLTACRPCNENCPSEIYTFETLSSTEWQSKDSKQFKPNFYVNIEGNVEQKIKALREYKTELRAYPHSRSEEGVKILAQYRGLEAGLKFAEAFCLIRRIEK